MTEHRRAQLHLLASTAASIGQRGVIAPGIDRAGVTYRATDALRTADQRLDTG